jgi:hypothetical protein
MPAFALVREAFRFYRLKSQTFVRTLFLFAYGLSILRSVFPRDDKNLADLVNFVFGLTLTGQAAPAATVMPAIAPANLLYFAVQTGVSLLLFLFTLLYASAYVAENEGQPMSVGVRGFLRSIPRLLAFLLLFFTVSIIASLIVSPAMMPFLLLAVVVAGLLTMYFLPLMISRRGMKLGWAMNRSYVQTRGHRFYIFNCLLTLTLLVNLVSSVFLFLLPTDIWVDGLLGGFFTAVLALMHGRLMGGLYFIVVQKRETLPGIVKKESESSQN